MLYIFPQNLNSSHSQSSTEAQLYNNAFSCQYKCSVQFNAFLHVICKCALYNWTVRNTRHILLIHREKLTQNKWNYILLNLQEDFFMFLEELSYAHQEA